MRENIKRLAIVASLLVSSLASADYLTPGVGSTFNWAFTYWCPYDQNHMYGTWGYVYEGRPWLVAGLCANPPSTPMAGNQWGYSGVPGPGTQKDSNCNNFDRVAGLSGYYDGNGVNSLRSLCLANNAIYSASTRLGTNLNGSFASVRCSIPDYAVGINGNERPRVLRIGVICRHEW